MQKIVVALTASLLLLPVTVSGQWSETSPGSPSTNIYFPRKVSIGSTTAPTRSLHVFGDAAVTTNVSVGPATPTTLFPMFVSGATSQSILKLTASDGTGALSGNVMSADWASLAFSADRVSGVWQARDTSVGWLTKQSGLFTFYGANGLTANATIGAAQIRRILDLDLATGNAGLGASPGNTRLTVSGPSRITDLPGTPYTMTVIDTTPYTTPSAGAGILFGASYTTGTNWTTIGVISAVKESVANGNTAAALVFGTRTNGQASGSLERMRITSEGKVGIGTHLPSEKLHVEGGAFIKQNLVVEGEISGAKVFNAVYQDVAEWVPAAEDMVPGTVVVLDPSTSNQVMPSHRAYDTTVAGVVSAQPGVLLGVAAATKEQIATTGRVRVKVDATRGAIRIGDILVTSDKPGRAMKSEPIDVAGIGIHRPGTVVGKALEPLADGEAEILVLLSLQ